MGLEDIPEVHIEHGGDYKFVQVEGPEGKNYIHGSSGWGSHNGVYSYDFLKSLSQQGIDVSQFRCRGGGSINFDTTNRVLKAYDRSSDFGDFDKTIVRSLLKIYVDKNLEGFSVEVR